MAARGKVLTEEELVEAMNKSGVLSVKKYSHFSRASHTVTCGSSGLQLTEARGQLPSN